MVYLRMMSCKCIRLNTISIIQNLKGSPAAVEYTTECS